MRIPIRAGDRIDPRTYFKLAHRAHRLRVTQCETLYKLATPLLDRPEQQETARRHPNRAIVELAGSCDSACRSKRPASSALSHAHLQQPQTVESALFAVFDAQHAVALLLADDDGSTLLQLRAALDAADTHEPAHRNARIGDVSYDELLSPPVLDQVRSRETVGPDVSPRSFFEHIQELAGLIESSAVLQVRAHARLTAVAAIHQQLGLALRAAGKEAEAQRACDFADEIAVMRPTMVKTIFGLDSAKEKRSFTWHWLGVIVSVFPSLGAIWMLHKLNEQRCVLPALHADDEDNKRGGGCLSLSAQPLPSVAANVGAQLTGPELVDLLRQLLEISAQCSAFTIR